MKNSIIINAAIKYGAVTAADLADFIRKVKA